jgi:outer membrane lipoprotein-sorting protein
MNCAECLENLVGLAEGLLDPEETLQCRAHLESCESCRAEYDAVSQMQQQLIARGQVAAGISIVDPVMRRIRTIPEKPKRNFLMGALLRHRWGLSFSAAACMLFLVIMAFVNTSKVQAAAADVMSKGAEVLYNLTTIHLRGQLRTLPGDNFSYIDSKQDFVLIELWKQFGPERKWRVDKPGRSVVMDGTSTIHFIKPDYAYKIGPSSSAFDTGWFHEMADMGKMLESELSSSKFFGWPMTLTSERDSDGTQKSVVTIEAKAGFWAGSYLKNKFFSTANTRRVYIFDHSTGLLESVKFYLEEDSGDELIFELEQIEYNQPIDPGVFKLQLPENVTWHQEMQILPDNEKYAAMTPEQAAKVFFEACGREDWNEAGKFGTMTEGSKGYLGGVEVIHIGDSFKSGIVSWIFGARFVPYEVKLKDGQIRKHNLALKRDKNTGRWFADGGY